MKIIFTFFTFIFSSSAYACFAPPEGLSESHQTTFFIFAGVSALLFIASLVIRFCSNKKRMWVPIVSGSLLGYVPLLMYVLFMEGITGPGGLCGRPELLEMGNVLIVGFTIVFTYEAFYYWRAKRGNGL